MSSALRAPMLCSKSARWVRLVVPTSRRRQPALAMIAGMRNDPPISMSSPRETITSLRAASAASTSTTAAALLFTTVAASAPVSSASSASTWVSRSPRAPGARSYSRLHGCVMTACTASTASAGNSARPRLVCSTVPVRLNTRRSEGWNAASRRAWRCRVRDSSCRASAGSAAPSSMAWRISESRERMAWTTAVWLYCAPSACTAGIWSTRSTAGNTAALCGFCAWTKDSSAYSVNTNTHLHMVRRAIHFLLKQEEIRPLASDTGFGHQDIERDARHIIRERVHVRVLVHVQDLEIPMAGIATLGLDRGAAALDAIVRNALGSIAENALDTDRVPLRVAEGAGQIAQAVVVGRGAGAHDAHHGRGTTRRAEVGDLEPTEGTGPERRDQIQPVRLQRRADEWDRRPIELFIMIAGEQHLGHAFERRVVHVLEPRDRRARPLRQRAGFEFREDTAQRLAPHRIAVPAPGSERRHPMFAAAFELLRLRRQDTAEQRQRFMLR